MREIRFYRTDAGHCPVEEFLNSLNSKQAQKVTWVLRLIEDMQVVPVQYFKKLVSTDDLWEARIQFGGDAFRLIGFFDGDALVILNHAFRKKTQKTPRKEIETAESRKQNYFRSGE